MAASFGLDDENGVTRRPDVNDLTAEQRAFLTLSVCVGMPRLDESTVPEFTRRATRWQREINFLLFDKTGPVIPTEEEWRQALGEYVAIWTNADPLTNEQFDQKMEKLLQ